MCRHGARHAFVATTFVVLLSFRIAGAQPSLDSLWPNPDQATWHYRFSYDSVSDPSFESPATLHLNGTVLHYGNTLQVLEDQHGLSPGVGPDIPTLPPLIRAVWLARPDLRAALEERYASQRGATDWWMALLHGGYFQETPDSFLMWQPDWDHPTWTYLQTPLTVGETFVRQLVPELADDIFLHGTVEALDATVVTLAGEFMDAVRMGYVIDYGISTITDVTGQNVGTFHSETRGHVHYVPYVGPVELLEEFILYAWVDCTVPDCLPESDGLIGVPVTTYSLSLSEPVTAAGEAIRTMSWSAAKASYR